MIFDSLEQLDEYRESERKGAAWIHSTADIEPELPSHVRGADRREDEKGMAGGSEARSCCFSIGLLVPCKRWRNSATAAQICSGKSSRPLVSEDGQGIDRSQGGIATSTRSSAGLHVELEPTEFDSTCARTGGYLQARPSCKRAGGPCSL